MVWNIQTILTLSGKIDSVRLCQEIDSVRLSGKFLLLPTPSSYSFELQLAECPIHYCCTSFKIASWSWYCQRVCNIMLQTKLYLHQWCCWTLFKMTKVVIYNILLANIGVKLSKVWVAYVMPEYCKELHLLEKSLSLPPAWSCCTQHCYFFPHCKCLAYLNNQAIFPIEKMTPPAWWSNKMLFFMIRLL